MSDSTNSRVRKSREMMSILKNVLATFGVICLLILLALYARGQSSPHPIEPQVAASLGKFATQVLIRDLATAGIVRIPLEGSVSIREAVATMKRQAARHQLKLAAESLPPRAAHGTSPLTPHTAILDFCNPEAKRRLLAFNPVLIPYLPCRITLYEDPEGIMWIAALDLELLITTTPSLEPEAKEPVIALKDAILAVMQAGANGKLVD